jgi:hypothetical protein
VAQPLSIDEAADRIREFATWTIFAPAADDVLAAIGLQKQAISPALVCDPLFDDLTANSIRPGACFRTWFPVLSFFSYSRCIPL